MALDSKQKETLQRVAGIAAYTVAGVMALFVVILMGGETFEPILRFLGLGYYAPGGLYADCSDIRNQNNSFCSRNRPNHDAEGWRDMRNSKGSAAFSLTER